MKTVVTMLCCVVLVVWVMMLGWLVIGSLVMGEYVGDWCLAWC